MSVVTDYYKPELEKALGQIRHLNGVIRELREQLRVTNDALRAVTANVPPEPSPVPPPLPRKRRPMPHLSPAQKIMLALIRLVNSNGVGANAQYHMLNARTVNQLLYKKMIENRPSPGTMQRLWITPAGKERIAYEAFQLQEGRSNGGAPALPDHADRSTDGALK